MADQDLALQLDALTESPVEKIATMEIEAENEQNAIEKAKDNAEQASWKDGDDAYSVACYAVLDDTGEILVER